MLIGVVLVAFVFLSGAFFHIREDVAFVPSSNRIVSAMLAAANVQRDEKIVDLGAGDGRFLIHAARRFPHATVVGYEGAYWVYLLGRFRLLLAGSSAKIVYGNFFLVDLSDADVVFTYLSIHAMKRLAPKFQKELKSGARVVSHAFSLPDRQPTEKIAVQMFTGATNVYVYQW